jgi:hypothetical protein
MGNTFEKILSKNEPKRVLFLGLDAAGKTTVRSFDIIGSLIFYSLDHVAALSFRTNHDRSNDRL